jgi:hypothetical protein
MRQLLLGRLGSLLVQDIVHRNGHLRSHLLQKIQLVLVEGGRYGSSKPHRPQASHSSG